MAIDIFHIELEQYERLKYWQNIKK